MFMRVQRKEYFHEVKDGMLNRRGEAELIGTFHLSPNENILSIARIKTFIICFI